MVCHVLNVVQYLSRQRFRRTSARRKTAPCSIFLTAPVCTVYDHIVYIGMKVLKIDPYRPDSKGLKSEGHYEGSPQAIGLREISKITTLWRFLESFSVDLQLFLQQLVMMSGSAGNMIGL